MSKSWLEQHDEDTRNAFRSKAFDVSSVAPPTELHKASRKSKSITLKSSITGGVAQDLDVNTWLPLAAPVYNISPDIRDYVIVPIPAVITNIPNTNGDSFSTSEMLKFQPKHGMPSYKTFKGKPTFYEHDNKDHTKAKGIIFDSYMQDLPRFPGFARVTQLLGFDRTRDPEIANAILNNKANTYSIGVWFSAFTCSICGHTVHQKTMQMCNHTNPRTPTFMTNDGRLGYRQCHNLTGFECSFVWDPAFVSAHHNRNQVLDVQSMVRNKKWT